MVLRPRCAGALLATLVVVAGLLAGCGGDRKPTKAQLTEQLGELATALEAGDADTAVTHLVLPPGRSIDELKPTLAKLIEKKDLSSAGVKLLTEKGDFGPLAELFPDKGPRRAERMGLAVSECWALRFDRAEVMARWTGDRFQIFRVDDVGKIVP